MTLLAKAKRTVGALLGRYYPRGLIFYHLRTRSRNCEPELWLVPKLVNRAGLAVDVGANEGYWSLQLVRYAKHVHAFEPNPICLAQLRRVLPRRVALHEVALSDSSGTKSLRFDPNNTGIGTIESGNPLDNNVGIKQIETRDVSTTCLDDFQLNGVELIKIDVEGHEEAVLRGAAATLERNRPTVICEIEERHNPGGLKRIRESFERRNYRAYAIDGDVVRPLAAIEAEGRTKLGVASGINNFIFADEKLALALFS
ncbi:MAG TPA: FkbM family methyltransferase [Rhizomicrobium sp.]